jgi:RecB family exonuclease
VFHRPLPYLYLARQVFSDARVPFQAFDALPLASEPAAALLDQVLAVARTGGSRDATLALMRSTLVAFAVDDVPVTPRDVSALDAVLIERRASGGADAFVREVDAYFDARSSRRGIDRVRAHRAAVAAREIWSALAPVASAPMASAQVRGVLAFIRRHEVTGAAAGAASPRYARARTAVMGALEGLAAAFERHDDQPRSQDDLLAAVRHALEARTFVPGPPRGGVHLVDAIAARFGAFDHVHVVGLVETDWPERPRRSVFYTSGLLTALSWPAETDQASAQQAAFRDLLGLARRTMSLHGFELEGDAVVAGSPMLEIARGLPYETTAVDPRPLFPDEVLTRSQPPIGLDEAVAAWLEARRARPALDQKEYRGSVGARAPEAYRVSRVDRYIDCPFKYFAESVLGLPEERPELAGLTPLERGTLLHELFERFYREWAARGRGTITVVTLPDALSLFAEVTRAALAVLPAADRALEETRLLGSIVARGVAERVFELEVDAGGVIAGRLLETELNGTFAFPLLAGLKQKDIAIRGKADRIDVFNDGSVRVVDYKLGRQPDSDAVQIGVYAHCATQALEARDGRAHPVRAAMYLAFGDDRRIDGRLGRGEGPPVLEVAAAAQRFAQATDAIEAGEFPPRPKRPSECAWCGFAGVCRKEYQAVDDDAAAEPV